MIGALNGLRALACLAVFGVHWQQFTGFAGTWGPFDARLFLENGNTGVALFFTLSAFLLSIRFWDGRWGQGRSWVGEYARSRAVRILPAYYVCLAVLVVITAHVRTSGERLDTALHVVLLHSLRERSFYSFAPSFWTIAVQAQSYLWMPIVLVLVSRISSSWRGRAIWIAGLTVAAYLLHWAMFALPSADSPIAAWTRREPTVAVHSLLAHVPHFLLGMFAALVYCRRRISRTDSDDWSLIREASVWFAGLAVLMILATPAGDRLSMPYGRYHFPFVPLLIVWIVLEAPRTRLARWILDAPPLNLLGVISFGVYVYHYPLMAFARGVMQRLDLPANAHPMLFGIVTLALTFIVAALSYGLIEQPLANANRAVARRARSLQPELEGV